jgi:hypothetical protein
VRQEPLSCLHELLVYLVIQVQFFLLFWSAWYFVGHGAEMMKMIADQAASSAADYTKNQGSSMFDEMMKKYQTK